MPHLKYLQNICEKAKTNPQSIIYPEASLDLRVLKGLIKAAEEKIVEPILIGKPKEISKLLIDNNLKLPKSARIIDHTEKNSMYNYLLELFLELRKHKGLKAKEAAKLMESPHYYASLLLKSDHGHGIVAGAVSTTAETFRPVFQIIKTKDQYHHASSFFFMIKGSQIYLFADCAININPDVQTLAEIAIDTAETAKLFNIEPKVALLSFSTKGSANSPETLKIQEALKLIKAKKPHLIVDGEMQVDAALVPEIAKAKAPNSEIKGDANILIFPNLESGNIAYKLTQRLGKYEAIGPIVQGLKKPVNDLSRGCSVEDVYYISAITSLQAQDIPFGL